MKVTTKADFDIFSQGGWKFFAANAAPSAPRSRQAIAYCRTFL